MRPTAIARRVATDSARKIATYTTAPTAVPTAYATESRVRPGNAMTPARNSGTAVNTTVTIAATTNFVVTMTLRGVGVASK
jgi:hypothetical protein